ncbi:hypothetical protein C1A23_00700 (plasmid) [Aeromonas hydrophila subsp. hydrophila]|nr:hypothetical protein C1A23_00700 [Aeromonas hydrophila subsp. hydrophila]
MSWRSESPFTVGFRAYVGFWFHCSPNPNFRRFGLTPPNYTQAFTLTVRYGEHDRLLANANCQPHGSEGMTDLPMR